MVAFRIQMSALADTVYKSAARRCARNSLLSTAYSSNMYSFILISALVALNWGVTPVAASAPTENSNFAGHSIASTNHSVTKARRFKHEIIPREYKSADWTSSPRDHASSYGATKRSLGREKAAGRREGENWLEDHRLVAAGGSKGVCMRKKATREGGTGERLRRHGAHGVCGRRDQHGERRNGMAGGQEKSGPAEAHGDGKSDPKGNKTRRGSGRSSGGGREITKEGLGPVKIEGSGTSGTEGGKSQGVKGGVWKSETSNAPRRGTRGVCSKTSGSGGKAGRGKPAQTQGQRACAKTGSRGQKLASGGTGN